MLKKSSFKLFAVAVFTLVSGSAFSAANSANVTVSASVSANCTISTTALAFGAYDPVVTNVTSAVTGSGSVTVACTKGATSLTIGMDNGLPANASGSQRRMASGAERLQYNLFQPPDNTPGTACPGTTAWGSTIGTNTLALATAPDKNARTYNVCGTIPGGQDVGTGSYADTVSATITF
jgi:spore coat protein U-like protein